MVLADHQIYVIVGELVHISVHTTARNVPLRVIHQPPLDYRVIAIVAAAEARNVIVGIIGCVEMLNCIVIVCKSNRPLVQVLREAHMRRGEREQQPHRC